MKNEKTIRTFRRGDVKLCPHIRLRFAEEAPESEASEYIEVLHIQCAKCRKTHRINIHVN